MFRLRNAQLVGTNLVDCVIEAEWQETGKHTSDDIQSLRGRKTLDFGEELGRIKRHNAA